MVQRRFIALVLSGLFLMSILPLFPSESFEPLQQTDENSVEGISEDQISVLESLPTSVKVSGRTGNSTTSPWGWAVKAGGSSYDAGHGIAVDSSGNAYATGYFQNTATFGSTSLVSSGGDDIFIAKLSSSGSWQWAVKAGDSGWDSGTGITVDSSGNAYATGYFQNTATFGSTSLVSSGGDDIFIAKIDSSGSWQWAVKAGGSDSDRGYGIAVDSSGNAYVTGGFDGTATFGSTSLTSSAYNDIFVAKLSSSGSWLWAVKAGGAIEGGLGIAVDSSGNAYVTGGFDGTAAFGSTSLTSSGSYDIFIAKIDTSGSWQWAVKAGDSGWDSGTGITVDSSGNAYATGYFQNTSTFGSTSLVSSGGVDIFVAKLSSSGSWQWVVKAGDSGSDSGHGIAVDSSGNAYVTGRFQETAAFGSTSLTGSGGDDIFIAKLTSSGSWQWVVKAGGSFADLGYGIAVDSSGNVYATGSFQGTGATFGSTTLSSSAGPDIFIAIHQDQDMDGVNNSVDSCSDGIINWTSDSLTDHDSDGCRDVDEDDDDDDDGITDDSDACEKGDLGWTSSSSTDHDGDGCQDFIEDMDDDDDGILDFSDACQKGALDWTPDSSTDYDSDGCRDFDEDDDDDDDGITDASDACEKGALGWTSNPSADHDGDGCQDSIEDMDDDDDGITDASDACEIGDLGWIPGQLTDYDSDGCQDAIEDIDDDDDGITDASDSCQKGDLGWMSSSSTDYDGDGCKDATEDDDVDGDGITDASDTCEKGDLGWTSNPAVDHDGDGCQDAIEDMDDDDDGILDSSDACQKGDLGWMSSSSTDYDGDGCKDVTEDMDDDDDGITDASDACQKGDLSSSTDSDGDGCKDATEDVDDDDDGVLDSDDAFPLDPKDWVDHDGDGVGDNSDPDDDNDGLTDELDDCNSGNSSWTSKSSTDHDSDGCQDLDEDLDDDNDRVDDLLDLCPRGQLGWVSSKSADFDSDGCQDSSEDVDDDNDGVLDAIEINAGTDSLDASSKPVDSFSVVVGNIELSTWDLIGIVLATLTSGFLAFAFVTRKGRYDAFSSDINDAQYFNLGKLEKKLELASFFRLLSPRQSIKLESLLDTRKENLGVGPQVDEPVAFPTQGSLTPPALAQPPMEYQTGTLDGKGYEWLKHDGIDWHRPANSGGEWTRWQ